MFESREQAGELLADRFAGFKKRSVVVVGIARGGMVAAVPVAKKLRVPLDFVVVKKVGAPGQPELAVDAKVSNGEVEKRVEKYRKVKLEMPLAGKNVILVDDGVATGATTRAAIKYLRKKNAGSICLAVPVAPAQTVKELEKLVDELIVLEIPSDFFAVGQFYKNFPQVADDEVIQLLQK